MNNIPDIINSDIISSSNDQFWSEAPARIKNLEPRPVLGFTNELTDQDAEKTLLTKMLQACKLDDAQYHVITLADQECLAWHQVRDLLQPQSIIVLGLALEQFGIAAQLMPHQVSRFNDRSWILTASLKDLIRYPDIKNHLWNYGLKPVFIDRVYG